MGFETTNKPSSLRDQATSGKTLEIQGTPEGQGSTPVGETFYTSTVVDAPAPKESTKEEMRCTIVHRRQIVNTWLAISITATTGAVISFATVTMDGAPLHGYNGGSSSWSSEFNMAGQAQAHHTVIVRASDTNGKNQEWTEEWDDLP